MPISAASGSPARHIRRQRGFGLLESLIALSLMALLFLGAMTLILSAGRSTVRTQAEVFATGDAANSIQNIIGQMREASAFALPTTNVAGVAESGTIAWNSMGGAALSQFSTTLNGETINTAIQVIAPPTMTPAANGYTASVPSLRVLSTTGGYWAAGGTNWPTAPYNVQALGSAGVSTVTLIYRGDANYAPNPDSGTYLWQYVLPADGSFNTALYPPIALCKSVATAANAVQFVRPYYQNVAEQNQLEVKIISSYYSPINGRQTSEAGNGTSSSQLTGKCVFMRDHYTGSITSTTSTRPSNNVFQYN